jgi:polygalacturonase
MRANFPQRRRRRKLDIEDAEEGSVHTLRLVTPSARVKGKRGIISGRSGRMIGKRQGRRKRWSQLGLQKQASISRD